MTPATTPTRGRDSRCVRDPAALGREMDALLEMAGYAESRERAELLHNVAGFVSAVARHDVDERGRCRGCRKPGRWLLWRRRHPCPLRQAFATWQLGQPEHRPAPVDGLDTERLSEWVRS